MNFNQQNPLSFSSVFAAVKRNDVNVLHELIKKGHNLNITDKRGWTPLHEAAALNHKKCLRILLKAGARANACTHLGKTALFIACDYNSFECARILIKWDFTLVNISTNESTTPLHICCTNRYLPLTQLLIKNYANINAKNNIGITSLDKAILNEDVEICKLLIESGVNLYSRGYHGNLPIHIACMIDNIVITKMLLISYKTNLHAVINAVNSDGDTPLMIAVKSGSRMNVIELLHIGADPNIANNEKILALHLAVHTGNLNLLERIYYSTSKDAIIQYCTMAEHELQSFSSGDKYTIKSLVCLAIDAESIECLEFLLNCGLIYDVLNCPVIISQGQSQQRFNVMRHYMSGSGDIEEEHTYSRSNRVVIHPISFVLFQKLPDLKVNTIKFLKTLLKHGFIFDSFSYKTDLIVLHPLEVALFEMSSYGFMLKSVVSECFHLMIEHGISPDYISPTDSGNSIPILFIYACLLGLVEIIPSLLKYSILVKIEDLFEWLVDYIFTHKYPVPVIAVNLIETYQYLRNYTTFPDLSKYKIPEFQKRFDDFVCCFNSDIDNEVPSLKSICRIVVRRTIHDSCRSCPYKFKLRLKDLELPNSLLSYLNFEELCHYGPEKT